MRWGYCVTTGALPYEISCCITTRALSYEMRYCIITNPQLYLEESALEAYSEDNKSSSECYCLS